MTQPVPPCRGLLIVFEGLDGAGKTTQLGLLADYLRSRNFGVACLREPHGWTLGKESCGGSCSRGEAPVTPDKELQWFLNDRRQHVEQRIRPALDSQQIVLLDRYYFSTMAYQGALGHDPRDIRTRNEAFAPPPDLLLLLDLPPAAGWQRLKQRGAPSHFERLDYLEQVAQIFNGMNFPYLRRIPADQAPQTVQAQIRHEVQKLLERQAQAEGWTWLTGLSGRHHTCSIPSV